MFKFAILGANLFGLLLLAGLLICAQPGRAEAGITGDLTVVNNTDARVEVYIDNMYWGYVDGFGNKTFRVGDSSRAVTTLYATNGVREWRSTITRNVDNYTWVLNP